MDLQKHSFTITIQQPISHEWLATVKRVARGDRPLSFFLATGICTRFEARRVMNSLNHRLLPPP